MTQGFALEEPGDSAVVEADGRVFLVALDRVIPGDPAGEENRQLAVAIERGLSESLAFDLFDAYARALQGEHGLRLDPAVAASVSATIQ